MGKLEYVFVGGISWKGFSQEDDLVAELFEQMAQSLGHVVIEQELHSDVRAICRGNEQVYLAAVVFVVSETLVNLRSSELREAVCRHRLNCFTILKQANDIVNGSSDAFHDGMATPNAHRTDDVTIRFRDRLHELLFRRASQAVNASAITETSCREPIPPRVNIYRTLRQVQSSQTRIGASRVPISCNVGSGSQTQQLHKRTDPGLLTQSTHLPFRRLDRHG